MGLEVPVNHRPRRGLDECLGSSASLGLGLRGLHGTTAPFVCMGETFLKLALTTSKDMRFMATQW